MQNSFQAEDIEMANICQVIANQKYIVVFDQENNRK